MRRPLLAAVVLLVLAFALVALHKRRSAAPLPAPEDRPALSPQRRAAIRHFWQAYNRATRLRVQGKWSEAATSYGEALELNPQHEDALYYLGNAWFELGRYDRAAAAWERLLEVYPRSARAHAQLGALYSCGAPGAPFDLERAEGEIEKALALNKEESAPVLKLGEIALLKGDRARALEYLSAGSRSNSRSVAAHYLLGYLRWKEGEGGAALESLRRAVEFSRGGRAGAAKGERKPKGGRPLLASGAECKRLLSAFLDSLEHWEGEVAPERMEEEYRKLDRFIRDLEAQWRQRAAKEP